MKKKSSGKVDFENNVVRLSSDQLLYHASIIPLISVVTANLKIISAAYLEHCKFPDNLNSNLQSPDIPHRSSTARRSPCRGRSKRSRVLCNISRRRHTCRRSSSCQSCSCPSTWSWSGSRWRRQCCRKWRSGRGRCHKGDAKQAYW